ncbi:RNA polymerase sigma factor [Mycobacterium phage Yecey3]|uniref:RNA polymerase sigma factor n=1 Tax=Mycobacterium phage Yecey3 TaxID=2656617 RepID=A0A649V8Z7_9CAUD|nr:sigma-K factor [Mycobacterium phage Yecey3]QGJ88807.1 RNA polymerase sigma factor [Mycobacterium phage Yecey3]
MDRVFREAAKAALFAWKQSEDGLEDLVNDIWVWYLESPETQRKLQEIEHHEAVKSVKNAALQMLSGQMLENNRFHGRNLYSSESVREALRGESDNRYLVDILPLALKALGEQNEGHAEAIRVRYDDEVVPARGTAAEAKLKKAVRSLTDHVNITAITAGVDADGNVSEGPGSRHSVFPESRKGSGDGHGDPTADMAINLIEGFKLDKQTVMADEPMALCALKFAETDKFGVQPQPVRGPGGRFLDSDEYTTLRKELMQ